MSFIHNITTVAHYEAKTLRRSWFFRLFSIGALVIFTFMNIGIYSPIGDESWDLVSISSSLPLINLYLLNIGQSIVVIFLAADFLKRDKKVDTNEVLYTRSMSNFEYITGKTLGILRLFITLDLVILTIGLVINIISKRMTLELWAYLEYLLIIPVPTIIFSLGLAFVLMSVIRNQAITFLVLLGYAAMNMFYLWFRAGSVFDYMAFGLPVFKSGMTGFDDIGVIANQRLIYLFFGLALVSATILLFKRLPQSKFQMGLAAVLTVIFTAGFGITLWNTLGNWQRVKNEKETVIDINRKYEKAEFLSVSSADIDLKHKGREIEATAFLRLNNDNGTPVTKYIFSLNPGLTVSSVKRNVVELKYNSDGHIIEIEPGKVLQPGESDSVSISYSGKIKESFCYPNYSDNIKEDPYRIAMVNVRKRQAFLTDDYMLLTPETHWYPVAGLNYYPSNPARIKVDFTRFTLNAVSEKGLTTVSQGEPVDGSSSRTYKPQTPLTGLTVAMGKYFLDSVKVDSVKYLLWHYKGNDYYKADLAELKDTLNLLVSGIMRELETNFTTKYPFKTLSIVEAPVHFYSFPKKNTQTRAEVQPSLVIVPEKLSTIEQAGFGKRFTRQKKNMARNNQVITDKELQVRLFNNFVRNTFISGENFRFTNGRVINEPTRFRLGPSFYFFRNNFYSSEYPVINAVFESHLQKLATPGRPGGFGMMMSNLSENDKANIILKGKSFRELLQMNPGDDTIRAVLTLKGDYLFNLIRSKAGIEEFKTWFKEYIDANSFKRINILTFNEDIKKRFGFEFYTYLNDWFNAKDQPGFLVSGLEAREIVVGERSRYQVTFIASNREKAGGLFNISFQTGGGGMMMQRITVVQGGPMGGGGRMTMGIQGRGMEASDISKIVYLAPGEARKITIILDRQPRAMTLNTLLSKNLPGEINFPIDAIIKSKEKVKEIKDSDEPVPVPNLIAGNELVVDNEDSGFVNLRSVEVSPLKKLLGVKREQGEVYSTVNMFGPPDYWQPVINTTYYGQYVRSAVYTRSGTGDRVVTWKGIIKQPGYYDVYVYIGKVSDRITFRGQGGGRGGQGGPGGGGPGGPGMPGGPQERADNPFKDLHYKVFHDDGVEEVTVEWENAEAEWNKIGTYYLSPDTVKVTLSNQSQGRIVIGDAVKWVLQK